MAEQGTLNGPRPVVAGSFGVLGGTFDPIHLGHLAIAEEARETLGLERVLLVPAGEPPHKLGRRISSSADRLAMVALAIGDNPAFELSRLEVDRPGPSYAIDTIGRLADQARERGAEPDLTFILSDEALADLPDWRQPRRLLELCRLAVVPRASWGSRTHRPTGPQIDPAWVAEHFPGLEDRFVFVDAPRIAISASEIRRRVSAGRSARYLVPPAVLAYISDHHLYTSETWRTDQP